MQYHLDVEITSAAAANLRHLTRAWVDRAGARAAGEHHPDPAAHGLQRPALREYVPIEKR
jgi:hypothetical protein